MGQIISIVVAMNQERVIGSNNQLPWHIPEDLAYFKQVTMGKPIIMGRKTFESIGRVLPGRKNIVISRGEFSHPGVIVYSSLAEAIAANQDAPELCIIGGGQIFKEALPLANKLHLTYIEFLVANPTTWFPEVDFAKWNHLKQSVLISSSGVKCSFNEYERITGCK